MKNILVAVDFSDSTSSVIHTTKLMARAFSSKVKIIHTLAPNPVVLYYYGAGGPLYVARSIEDEMAADQKSLNILKHMLEKAGIEAECVSIEGPTVDMILEAAEDFQADLIIAGAHHHGALYSFFVGTVSEKLIRQAPCPICIVPHIGSD